MLAVDFFSVETISQRHLYVLFLIGNGAYRRWMGSRPVSTSAGDLVAPAVVVHPRSEHRQRISRGPLRARRAMPTRASQRLARSRARLSRELP